MDSAYEFCKWINPQEQECDFVWKRAEGNITTQECHSAFSEKVPVVIIIVNINIKIIATVILASVNATTQEFFFSSSTQEYHGTFYEKVGVVIEIVSR